MMIYLIIGELIILCSLGPHVSSLKDQLKLPQHLIFSITLFVCGVLIAIWPVLLAWAIVMTIKDQKK